MDADALLHPRGPLPPATYWQRRVITLLAVVLVVAAGLRACGGDDKDPSALTADPSPSGSATASPSSGATSPAAAVSASPRPSASPSASPTRAAGQPCRDTDLLVTATANAKEYAAGVRPRLTLVVTNRAPVSCTRDLGGAALELSVRSGSDQVWSSDHCSPGGAPDVVTLAAGSSRSFPVTWSRTRSLPGCPPDRREPVAPGTYRVYARVGSIGPRPGDTFSLRG